MSRNEGIILNADADVGYNRHAFPSEPCNHESQIQRTGNYEHNLDKFFYFVAADEPFECALSNGIWRMARKFYMT